MLIFFYFSTKTSCDSGRENWLNHMINYDQYFTFFTLHFEICLQIFAKYVYFLLKLRSHNTKQE